MKEWKYVRERVRKKKNKKMKRETDKVRQIKRK